MNPKDLMIGDWVQNQDDSIKGRIVNIDAYQNRVEFGAHTIDADFVYPIPLTAEILEKNEFKKNAWWKHHKDDTVTYAIGNGFQIEIEERMINGKDEKIFNLVDNCRDDGDYGYESNLIVEVKYVHKLQHLLKDLEIEKEIIL